MFLSPSLRTMTINAAALKVLHDVGRPLDFPELLTRTSDLMGSEVNEKSLRGTLPRLVKTGQVAKVGRGRYALSVNDFGPVDETGPKEANGDDDSHPETVAVGASGTPQPAE